MIWLFLILMAAMVAVIIRSEITAHRVARVEAEVNDNVRPRLHDLANDVHVLMAKDDLK